MRHMLAVVLVAVFALTLGVAVTMLGLSAARADDKPMPNFKRVSEPTACGQDPTRPNYCGTVERICLSPPAFVDLVKSVVGVPVFIGIESNGATLLILMGSDQSIGVFSLEQSGRACLLASSLDDGAWNKEIIKGLFLGDGHRITM